MTIETALKITQTCFDNIPGSSDFDLNRFIKTSSAPQWIVKL